MNQQEAHKHLSSVFLGFLASKSIQVAGELGIADHLIGGPLPIAEIARRTNTKTDLLYRLLRLLSSNGIFREEEGKAFSLTPPAELLRRDVPGSYYPFAKLVGDLNWRPAEDLMVAMKDGEIPFTHHYGKHEFDYIFENPELVGLFNDAMLGFNWPGTEAILESCDFSNVDTFADIGGGNGHVIVSILKKYPRARGVLFDQPEVVEQTRKIIDEAGVSKRCTIVGGSFFESIPVRADTFFLRHILHDWNDEECITILRHLATVSEPGARVLIAECVIGEPNEGAIGTQLDMLMLIALTGRERTVDEYEALLQAAGFQLTNVTPTASIITVVEGTLT
jgi:hypothetical protein